MDCIRRGVTEPWFKEGQESPTAVDASWLAVSRQRNMDQCVLCDGWETPLADVGTISSQEWFAAGARTHLELAEWEAEHSFRSSLGQVIGCKEKPECIYSRIGCDSEKLQRTRDEHNLASAVRLKVPGL